MTPGRIPLLALLLLLPLALPPTAGAGDDLLRGRWTAQSDGARIDVAFGKAGRITIAETRATGTQTSRGRYRIEKAAIIVTLDGEGGVLRYPFQLVGGVLRIRDQDGTLLRFQRLTPKTPPPQVPTPRGVGCTPVKTMVQWKCIDRGGLKHPATGRFLEAFRMWVPEGWRVSGGVRWKLNGRPVQTVTRSDLVSPAVIEFTITAPDGDAAITVYAGERFTDLTGSPAARLLPKGSKYGGTIVWPPLTPRAYVQEILLPRYFRQARSLRIVGSRNTPQLAAHFRREVVDFNRVAHGAGIAHMSVAAGITTVEFQARGKTYRELFVTAPMTIRMPGMVMWWPRMAWSLRARKSCMQRMLPSLLTSIYSFRMNAWWFLIYQRLVDKNWAGVAVVDATVAKIDATIVASRAKTASVIHRQLYPVLTGMATKAAPGYAPIPLDGMKNHAVDPQGRLRELPDGQDMSDLPPGWLPMKQVPVK